MTPTKVIAIDPGSERSALVWCDVGEGVAPPWTIMPMRAGELTNAEISAELLAWPVLVIETMATLYASNAAAVLLQTERWAGRLIERYAARRPDGRVIEVSSSAARAAVCGTTRAKDADVRRGLIDAYGGDLVAFGKRCAQCKGRGWYGRDREPCACRDGWDPPKGPLHGWTGTHLFRALAVAWAAFVPGGPGRADPA